MRSWWGLGRGRVLPGPMAARPELVPQQQVAVRDRPGEHGSKAVDSFQLCTQVAAQDNTTAAGRSMAAVQAAVCKLAALEDRQTVEQALIGMLAAARCM